MKRVNWLGHRSEMEAMLAEGASLRDLVNRFGGTITAVWNAMRRMGLSLDVAAKEARQRARGVRLAQDPRTIAARNVAIARLNRTPAKSEAARRNMQARWADPACREAMVSALRATIAAEPRLIESRRRGGRARARLALSWCPAARIDEYKTLRDHLSAAEAKRVILDDIAAKERASQESMTHFERQLARVEAGVNLEERFIPPTLAPAYTLGGVSAGW